MESKIRPEPLTDDFIESIAALRFERLNSRVGKLVREFDELIFRLLKTGRRKIKIIITDNAINFFFDTFMIDYTSFFKLNPPNIENFKINLV